MILLVRRCSLAGSFDYVSEYENTKNYIHPSIWFHPNFLLLIIIIIARTHVTTSSFAGNQFAREAARTFTSPRGFRECDVRPAECVYNISALAIKLISAANEVHMNSAKELKASSQQHNVTKSSCFLPKVPGKTNHQSYRNGQVWASEKRDDRAIRHQHRKLYKSK